MRVVSGARHGRLTTLKFLNDGRMACLGEETTLRGDGVGINPGFGQQEHHSVGVPPEAGTVPTLNSISVAGHTSFGLQPTKNEMPTARAALQLYETASLCVAAGRDCPRGGDI